MTLYESMLRHLEEFYQTKKYATQSTFQGVDETFLPDFTITVLCKKTNSM